VAGSDMNIGSFESLVSVTRESIMQLLLYFLLEHFHHVLSVTLCISHRAMAAVLVYQHGDFLMMTHTTIWHCQQMKSMQYGRPNGVGGTGFPH